MVRGGGRGGDWRALAEVRHQTLAEGMSFLWRHADAELGRQASAFTPFTSCPAATPLSARRPRRCYSTHQSHQHAGCLVADVTDPARCLYNPQTRDPAQRATAQEVLCHVWVREDGCAPDCDNGLHTHATNTNTTAAASTAHGGALGAQGLPPSRAGSLCGAGGAGAGAGGGGQQHEVLRRMREFAALNKFQQEALKVRGLTVRGLVVRHGQDGVGEGNQGISGR